MISERHMKLQRSWGQFALDGTRCSVGCRLMKGALTSRQEQGLAAGLGFLGLGWCMLTTCDSCSGAEFLATCDKSTGHRPPSGYAKCHSHSRSTLTRSRSSFMLHPNFTDRKPSVLTPTPDTSCPPFGGVLGARMPSTTLLPFFIGLDPI